MDSGYAGHVGNSTDAADAALWTALGQQMSIYPPEPACTVPENLALATAEFVEGGIACIETEEASDVIGSSTRTAVAAARARIVAVLAAAAAPDSPAALLLPDELSVPVIDSVADLQHYSEEKLAKKHSRSQGERTETTNAPAAAARQRRESLRSGVADAHAMLRGKAMTMPDGPDFR